MNIRRKIEIMQGKIMAAERGLKKIYNKILSQNQGRVTKTTESMTGILRITEDLKKEVGQFLTDFKIDSS